MTEHGQAVISRLVLAGAAYDPTRVAVGPYAVHTGITHNQRADRRRPAPHGPLTQEDRLVVAETGEGALVGLVVRLEEDGHAQMAACGRRIG